MTTLYPVTYERWKKQNGTYAIAFRIVHNREATTFPSGFYASKSQLLPNLTIKDSLLKKEILRKQMEYERILLSNSETIEQLPVKNVVSLLIRQNRPKTPPPSCLAFLDIMLNNGTISKSRIYIYRSLGKYLQKFFGNDYFVFAEITGKMVANFQNYLRQQNLSTNSVQSYMSVFRAFYNKAKEHYNDYDNNVLMIKGEPFRNVKIGAPIPSGSIRYISLDKISILIQNPLPPVPWGVREELARDVFVLSFGLIGMNAIDLFELRWKEYDGEYIEYRRHKVADKRADGGRFRVKVQPVIADIIAKYHIDGDDYLLDFHKRYYDVEGFRDAVNKGLEQLSARWGIRQHVTHYCARHSWASIAYNDLNADERLVSAALNHARPDSVTDFYINKERKINDLNEMVLKLTGIV